MVRQVLKDRVAIVTGATRGLGEGITRAMSREGAVVAMFGRNITLLKQHEKEIPQTIAFRVDVSDGGQVTRAVGDVLARFGRIDILVNNAGIGPSAPFLEISDEIRGNVMNINFNGVWNCTRAVLPAMLKQKYGKIINISSVTGPMVSGKGMTIYSASKGAVSAFTRALALEVAEYGINVNAICPGTFVTPMISELARIRSGGHEEEYIKNAGKEIPLGRLGSMEEMGDLAVFLASDSSKYITGTETVIDGGNIIREHK